MLGSGQIDSLARIEILSIAGDLRAPGAARAAAQVIAAGDEAVVCLHGIDEGDALALATRFDRLWAYRGGQALLWTTAFLAAHVSARYLPGPPLRPFDRRGFLEIDGAADGVRMHLIATQFSTERAAYIRELRFARRIMRAVDGAALLFVDATPPGAAGLRDPGFDVVARDRGTLIAARAVNARASIVRV